MPASRTAVTAHTEERGGSLRVIGPDGTTLLDVPGAPGRRRTPRYRREANDHVGQKACSPTPTAAALPRPSAARCPLSVKVTEPVTAADGLGP